LLGILDGLSLAILLLGILDGLLLGILEGASPGVGVGVEVGVGTEDRDGNDEGPEEGWCEYSTTVITGSSILNEPSLIDTLASVSTLSSSAFSFNVAKN